MQFHRPAAALLLQLIMATTASAQIPDSIAELENRLLGSQIFSLDFQVSTSGAVGVNIEGSLKKDAAGDISLHAVGEFAGQEVDLFANKAAQSFEFGSRAAPQNATPPPALWEALLIGFTRMGILHNIANLSANMAPDHADGGVAEWVVVQNEVKTANQLTFDILVSNTPSGSAILFLNEDGLPERRQQTVAFPGGEMRVVETYSNVESFD